MDKLKIFAIDTGATEWVAAVSEQAAVEFMRSETGCDYSDDETEINEVPESQWPILMVQYDEIDTDGNPVKKSFDTIMNEVDEGDIQPFLIACSEI